MPSNLSEPDLKVLWGRSGNRCVLCFDLLSADSSKGQSFPIGEAAHIRGEKSKAARYVSDYPLKSINTYENRILLCPTCHTKIDKKENVSDFSIERLEEEKYKHEKKIDRKLQSLMVNITFHELEVVLEFIKLSDSDDNESLRLIKPKEKIAKNELSTEVENLIKLGMVQGSQIREYFNKHPDINFASRVKKRFVEEYNKLKMKSKSDVLFYELFDFASNNHAEFEYRAAGLVVLSYFFNNCDVFEK